jgi:hypothetical protein
MEAEEAKRLVQEIKNQKLFNGERISSFLQSKDIATPSDKLKLFGAMAGDSSLDRNFLKKHLLEVASDKDEFADLLLILSEKECAFVESID